MTETDSARWKAIIWAAQLTVLLCVLVTIDALRVLGASPAIGATLRGQGEIVKVVSVARGGAAQKAGLRVGDRVDAVFGKAVHPQDFPSDPDVIESWPELDQFWRYQDSLEAGIALEHGLTLTTPRLKQVTARAAPLGLQGALSKTYPYLIVAWTNVLVAVLLLRKRPSEATLVNFVVGAGVCLFQLAMCAYSTREVCLPGDTFQRLATLNYLSAQTGAITSLHLIFAFPEPLKAVRRYPWLKALPWTILLVQLGLHFSRALPNPVWTTYIAAPATLGAFLVLSFYRLFRDPSPVVRRQLQWVVLGFLGGVSPWVLFTALPVAWGVSYVPEELTLLSFILVPVGISLAVVRYRLLDVGDFLDWLAVHGLIATLFVGAELLLWLNLGERFGSSGNGVPFFVLSVVFVVLLYAPLRTLLAQTLARLTRQATPDTASALAALLDRASSGKLDPWTAFEQTIEQTLKPRSSEWVDECGERFGDRVEPRLGVELELEGEQGASAWIPVGHEAGVRALVVAPSRGFGWTRGDLQLASLLAQATEPLIAAAEERSRHELTLIAHREQREELMRELHDGIGNQLFAITLQAESTSRPSPDRTEQALLDIKATAADALDSLRTGLSFLAVPQGAFGPAALALSLRAKRSLEASGVTVATRMDDACATLELDARQTFQLLRVMQEALGNAARHARARHVTVTLSLTGESLGIGIDDDGVGFDAAAPTTGSGIANMKQRVETLGGDFSLETAPGKGCKISLSLRLASAQLASAQVGGSPET